MLAKQRNFGRGFTLMELSIVLGIFGMLMAATWSAASLVYDKDTAMDLVKEIQVFQQNVQVLFSSTVASSDATYDAGEIAWTDTCAGSTPCSTNLMLQAGVFSPGFIVPNKLVPDPSGSGKDLYATKYGYPIWTGIENTGIYTLQAEAYGECGASPLPACPTSIDTSSTVLEFDIFNLSPTICTYLLMDLVNAKIDGMVGIATPTASWGPLFAAYAGNTPAFPTSMSLPTATKACSSGKSDFWYDTSSLPQIWMLFRNR
jgi:prepilin-type N-terminal cleavage/methylation domain-containing protein